MYALINRPKRFCKTPFETYNHLGSDLGILQSERRESRNVVTLLYRVGTLASVDHDEKTPGSSRFERIESPALLARSIVTTLWGSCRSSNAEDGCTAAGGNQEGNGSIVDVRYSY